MVDLFQARERAVARPEDPQTPGHAGEEEEEAMIERAEAPSRRRAPGPPGLYGMRNLVGFARDQLVWAAPARGPPRRRRRAQKSSGSRSSS